MARHSEQQRLVAPETEAASHSFMVAQASSNPWQKLSSNLFIEAWSLVGKKGTWTDLWKVPAQRPTDCLNGMRVLSMVCIVMGHSFGICENNVGFDNPEDVLRNPLVHNAAETNFALVLIMNPMETAVDSFYFISGFLLAFTSRGRPAPILKGTVLRYFRIVPAMAFMILMYGWVSPYLMWGPFAPRAQQSILRKCEQYWWSNLLYTMNYIPSNPSEICAGWTWYLANDFLFYILGLILMSLWKWKASVAWAWVGLISFASLLASGVYIYQHKLGTYFEQGFAYEHYPYCQPWHRVPVFLIGMAFPWILEILKKRGLDRDTTNAPKSMMVRAAWVAAASIAFAVMMTIIFIPQTNYPNASGTRKAENWSRMTNTLFMTFCREVWAIMMGVITLACYYGYLPFCSGALGHWIFHPLAKLTYTAYLFHPVIIKTLAGNMLSYFHYSLAEVLLHALSHFVMAYCFAIVVYCIVEKPCGTLVDAALPKKAPAPTPAKGGDVTHSMEAGASSSQVDPTVSRQSSMNGQETDLGTRLTSGS